MARVNHLTGGRTKSCGCARGAKATHGMRKSREYSSWSAMIQRCTNQKNPGYRRYGGAGITVCERWIKNFAHFLEDMGARPDGMTLDRRDPGGNYEPGNCRWATPLTQARNRRKATISVAAASEARDLRSKGLTGGEIQAALGITRNQMISAVFLGQVTAPDDGTAQG